MSYFDPSGKTPCSENKTMGLPGHYDDDEITVNDLDTEKRLEAGKNNDVAPCVMLERCACGSLSCQARDLSVAPSRSFVIHFCVPKLTTPHADPDSFRPLPEQSTKAGVSPTADLAAGHGAGSSSETSSPRRPRPTLTKRNSPPL